MNTKLKVVAETEGYVAIKCPPTVCRAEAKDVYDGVRNMMEFYEECKKHGARPLDYAARAETVVCEKTARFVP